MSRTPSSGVRRARFHEIIHEKQELAACRNELHAAGYYADLALVDLREVALALEALQYVKLWILEQQQCVRAVRTSDGTERPRLLPRAEVMWQEGWNTPVHDSAQRCRACYTQAHGSGPAHASLGKAWIPPHDAEGYIWLYREAWIPPHDAEGYMKAI